MNDLSGNTKELRGIVEYQDGSIVSREIIKKDTGTVTIFAFDAGQGLSEHTVSFDALVYIIDGEAEVRIGENTHRVREGNMIIMPANRPHSLQAIKRFKMLLVLVK
jgi:quercetin dioxygenase-like cupin family protein